MVNLPAANGREPVSEPSSRPRSRDRANSKSRHTRSSSAMAKTIADEFSGLTPAETAEQLQTSLTSGLTPAEALARLHDQGPNELPHEPPEPLWLRFIKQFKETLILLLLGSAVMSVIAGNKDDAISIAVAVTIVVTNTCMAPSVRDRPEAEALMAGSGSDADSSMAEAVSQKTMASKLVPGDLVLFTTGDRIPADIRVTKASDLTIDESNLTGENEPVRITAEARHADFRPGSSSLEPPTPSDYASPASGTVGADISLNSTTNIAFMGTLVRSGHGQGIVYATGGNTHFGTIAASVSETESPRTPLQLSMDDLGNHLSQASFVIIAVISLVGWLQGKAWLDIFTISISLAVAAIPEGLPIIVTVTLALGVHRMARHNAIVRKMPSVETLGSVNVVCSDKTGTLTMNHMTTVKMWYFDADAPLDVDSDDETVESKADTVALRILRIGNIANNARLTHLHAPSASSVAILSSTQGRASGQVLKSRWVGQPTDVAMLDMLDRFREHDVREGLGHRIGETPFSSERKWMGVTIGDLGPEGTSSPKEHAYIKGAIERVLERCDTYLTKDGREVHLDAEKRQQALQAAEKLASKGLRVLGFASGPVARHAKSLVPTSRSATPVSKLEHHVSHNEDVYNGLTFAGLVGMSDPPRTGVSKSIRRLMRGGVKVIMITGDAETTALAIAKKLGMPIAEPRAHSVNSVEVRPVLRGDEIDEMTDGELQAAIANTSVFARTSPDHKMKIIRALQARGDIVAMTGDGVNDAPALKKADIGISMGLQGTDVAKEAADMILTDDDFSTILKAIEEGKGIFSNIQNFLTFQLSTSAAALSLVLVCTCLGFKNPLNAMQILWISKHHHGWTPAQSLGVEPVDPDVMNRPPRKRNAPVLTRALITRVLTSATIIMLGTMAVYTHEMLSDGKVSKRDTTMTFTCFVLFDMFNALNCRSESKSVLRGEVGLFSNKLFNWAVSLSLGGQILVIYFPWLQEVFQTEALALTDLVGLVILTSSVFWADEARKWWKSRSRSRLGSGYSQVMHPTKLPQRRATHASTYPMPPPGLPNGSLTPLPTTPSPESAQSSIHNASSLASIQNILSTLHTRDAAITTSLQSLISSQASLSRDLGRLDLLRAHLGTNVIHTRAISNGMLDNAAGTAEKLSSKVKELDLEKKRVEETLGVVEQVAELKASGYIARASKIPAHIVEGNFAARTVPSVEVPDAPGVTIEEAKKSLCGLFLREFEKAAEEGDGVRVTRFFKLFPLIGREEVGLDVYGKYVCQGVAGTARKNLKEGAKGERGKEGFFYAQALTRLFEHIAQIVEGHGGLVERHYGAGKMVRVIERLQAEADVQGGIVLDTWGDEKNVDRRLTDVRSYPFSFLVQSFLPNQRPTGISRTGSPAVGVAANGRASEDEGVDMKEVDGLLNEMAVMLGRWSLYARFLSGKCRDPEASPDEPLIMPELLDKSALSRKISNRLKDPFNVMTTFFFRRSVEKAFQLDESPTGLSLNLSNPIDGNAPYIISAVDDVMYIVNTVLKRSISTSQRGVIESVIPAISRVLGTDFVGMIQRKMRDESYPRPLVQGGFPPEDRIIAFIVLINSLVVSNDYISRIVSSHLQSSETNSASQAKGVPPAPALKDMFPYGHDDTFVSNSLTSLNATFSSKTNELISEGLQVMFNNVIKPRLRPVLSETFRDVDYSLTSEDLAEIARQNDTDDDPQEILQDMVSRRFEHHWDALMKPIQRIMSTTPFNTLLEQTAQYLARVLERRVWNYSGKMNALGATRMERDYGGIVGVIARGGKYGLRDVFARVLQVAMVVNMDEEEWEAVNVEGGGWVKKK
ncbi:calcium-transporting P-type ATPase [Botrytis cinerea]